MTIGRDRLALLTNQQVGRARLCALRVDENVLPLQTLLRPGGIRAAILEGLDKGRRSGLTGPNSLATHTNLTVV
ncbi:hypothetical protein G6024_04945 [Dietzia maris]|nr:hypothetical protein [Dietzia maris]MBB0996454.1 hypothetical protein [Dietzia maris]